MSKALEKRAEDRKWLKEGRLAVTELIHRLGPIVSNPIALYIGGNILLHHLDEKHTGWLDAKSAEDFKGGLAAVSLAWAAAAGIGGVIPD